MSEEYKNRVLESCKDMIAVDPSGSFYYFWLSEGSCLNSDGLRTIADELDKRNAGYEEYFFDKLSKMSEQSDFFEREKL